MILEWLGPAAAAVSEDAALPLEIQANANASDRLLPVEFLSSLYYPPIPIEWTVTARSDQGLPTEVIGLIPVGYLQLEWLASAEGVVRDSVLPIEAAANAASADSVIPAEFLSSMFPPPVEIEWLAGALADQPVAGEWAGHIPGGYLQVEWLAGARVDGPVPLEALASGALVAGDAFLPFAILAVARGDTPSADEATATMRADPGMPAEWTGLAVAVIDAQLPFAILAAGRGDGALSGESLLALTTAAAAARALSEIAASARGDQPLQTELTGAAVAVIDLLLSVGALAGSQADSGLGLEMTLRLAADKSAPMESQAATQTDAAAAIEGGAISRSDAPAPNEAVAFLAVDLRALFEQLVAARSGGPGAVESTGTARSDQNISAEGSALLISNAAAVIDALAEMAGADAMLPAEWQAILAHVLTDAGIPFSAEQLSTIPLISISRLLASKNRRRLLRR